VILNPIEEVSEGEKLLVAYMNRFGTANRRRDDLVPFDRSAVRLMIEQSNGRPGRMLEMAHGIIEEGAREQWKSISATEVITYLQQRSEETRVAPFPRRTRLGSVD